MKSEMNDAATKVQSAQRGNKDRELVSQMKIEKKEGQENDAATKVQSIQRGKKERERVS